MTSVAGWRVPFAASIRAGVRLRQRTHFPKIETFPHHKHLQNEVIAFHKPDITKVIEEAQLFAQCPEKTLTKGDHT